ncbi:MAG: hypothetical protein KGS61_21875, partial [Verrucomicrobia bacterium]|nr:hypothetical protein [Verrucomicrobiota bacterium]
AADGYVRGEGVGVVLLKRLSDARRDGDRVIGLIRGSAVNHGGRVSSLTAPNPNAQAEVIKDALRDAGVPARSITYIEAHGTGTQLGDPVEVNGLKRAFADLLEDGAATTEGFCRLGSVKTNIGHLEAASGIAGIVKTLLALRHRTIPASLHLKQVNPYIKIEGSPFRIVRETEPWSAPADGVPRRAGVSSFGFGGANAHVVLEEYDEPAPARSAPPPYQLVVLSARKESELREVAARLSRWLADNPDASALSDVAFSLNEGRTHFPHRCAAVVQDLEELRTTVEEVARGGVPDNVIMGVSARPKPAETSIYELAARSAVTDLRAATDASAWRQALRGLAALYVKGSAIDWAVLRGAHRPRRVTLPTYPFHLIRYWISATTSSSALVPAEEPLVLFRTEWVPAPAVTENLPSITGLLVVDASGLLFEWLKTELGVKCRRVRLDEDFRGLVEELRSRDFKVSHALLFASGAADLAPVRQFLCQLAAVLDNEPLRLTVVCAGNRRAADPVSGAFAGLVRSVALERPQMRGRVVVADATATAEFGHQVVAEMTAAGTDGAEICLEAGQRWLRSINEWQPIPAHTAAVKNG